MERGWKRRGFPALPCSPHSLVPRTPLFPALPCSPHSLVPRTPLFAALPCSPHSLVPRTPLFPALPCSPHSLGPRTPLVPALPCSRIPLFPALPCSPHSLVPRTPLFPALPCSPHSLVPRTPLFPVLFFKHTGALRSGHGCHDGHGGCRTKRWTKKPGGVRQGRAEWTQVSDRPHPAEPTPAPWGSGWSGAGRRELHCVAMRQRSPTPA